MTTRMCFQAGLLVCAVALLLAVHPLVLAQVTTGRIAGVVTDPSGSALPDVTVTVTQVDTATSTTVITDAIGNYLATNLKIGTYTVSFQKQGFQRSVQSNVDVGIGQVIRVDVALKVGVVTQTVEVTGAAPLLQTETSALGTIESEKRIVELPLNGRNFFKLAFLGPGANQGATGTSAGAGSTDNNRPGTALSVNGLRIFDNNFLLDGLDNNEFGNGTVVIQPPPDSIQEFRVEENSMNAEFGRGGAMVNIVLRSGTNQLHGAGWEFLRNDRLDARNFFASSQLGFQRNQYGGQLGGPIIKDKMFIFGSIQRSDIREEQPFISTVPTKLMHSGNFSELGPTTNIPNPFVPGTFFGNTIPGTSINSVGQNIVNLFPLPNIPGAGLTNNFIFNGKYKFDETAIETRFDYNISSKDRFFAHYAIATPDATNPSNFPNVDGGAGSGTSSTLNNRVQSLAGDWSHIFNPGLLNDLRAGFIRFRDATLPIDFGSNAGNTVGIPNADHPGTPNSSGLTKINISGYQQLGDSLWVPETIVENVYQLADTLSWTHGKHSLKFGIDFRRQQRNFFQQTAPSGLLTFSGNYTNIGNGLADTLLGIPQSTLQDHLFGIVDPTRYWDLSEFVQDDIRVTPNLTLNLGLRYEISSPAGGPTVGNFDLNTLTVNTSSHGGVGFDKKDWAPRVGFAWTVRPKTVIRSGGGIFYAPEGNIFDDLGLNPPALAVQSFNYPSSNPSTNQLLQAFPTTFTPVDPNNPTGTVRTTGTVRRIPRIYEWNLTVEQQLSQNWLFRAGYVGTRSTNLFDHESSNLNQPYLPLDSNFANGNSGRPYFATRPGLNVVLPLDVARLSMFYNALQTSLEHRFAGGFNVLAAYTYAKSLGTADGNVNQCDIQNAHNVAAEKGPTTPDFRHQLVVSYVYELPYGKGKHFGSNANAVAQSVLGGWQVAGVTTVHSGEAFDVLMGSDLTNTGAFPPRPDIIHNPYDFSFGVATQAALGCSNPGHQTRDCWFNQAAFVAPPLATTPGNCGGQCGARDFGNAGRAVLRGPDLVNFDFSAYKTFQLSERFGLVFRAEFFNIFNHPNFNLPNVGSGGGSSGAGFVNFSCTQAAPPTPTDCSGRSAGGAAITQTLPDAQREIQFGLKLQF
ncbi:MAG TPA: carboxypeptidase regulatory-like domain-containing protein [Terriglobales bacterium]|nr:carboxypeptidase regulatory-like domain-containing protein [Terriglobales bacterium]